MYRVSPSDARTDLYGVGKGAAQVVDLSPTREAAAQEEERNFRAKQIKEGRESDLGQDVYSKLGTLDSQKIFQRDQPLFAKMKEELFAQTKQDIAALKKGDTDAWIRFHSKFGDISQQAELSKNTREEVEAIMRSGKYDKAYPKDQEAFMGWVKNGVGDYNLQEQTLTPKINFFEDVYQKKLIPLRDKQMELSGRVDEIGVDETEAMVEDALRDPSAARAAIEDFNSESDENLARLGLTRDGSTPSDYYKALYATKLAKKDVKAAPSSKSGGSNKNTPKVNWQAKADGTFKYDVTKNWKQSQPVTFIDPLNPGDGTKENQGRSITVKPLEIRWDKSGRPKLLAVHTEGKNKGRNELLDYDAVQKWMYTNFDISNPIDFLQKTEAGEGKQKSYTLSIKESDIAAKAKAAGYTESEYRELLKTRKVKIIK